MRRIQTPNQNPYDRAIRSFTGIAFLLIFSANFPVAAAESSTVLDSELSIGGISLGAEESSVLRSLGQPTRITDTGDFLTIRLDYPGLTIWLGEERRAWEILSTSPQHCTPAGVCPGMAFSQVKALHGSPIVANREDGQFMEYFPESNFPCWLQLAVAGGVVKSVRAECQP